MLHITKKYNPKKYIFPTKFRLTRVKLKDCFLITARKVNRDSVIPRRRPPYFEIFHARMFYIEVN